MVYLPYIWMIFMVNVGVYTIHRWDMKSFMSLTTTKQGYELSLFIFVLKRPAGATAEELQKTNHLRRSFRIISH